MTKKPMGIKPKKSERISRNIYLNPGTLAKLRDRKASSKSCTDIGKKRVVLGLKNGAKSDVLSEKEFISTPIPMQEISSTIVSGDSEVIRQSQLPNTPTASTTAVYDSYSRFESLSTDILVKILCNLRHDQLRAVFHVSQRLRTAVLIARQYHFNFITPDRPRQEMLKTNTPPLGNCHFEREGGPDCSMASSPHTPNAPIHDRRCTRAHPVLIKQLAAVLFTEPSDRT